MILNDLGNIRFRILIGLLVVIKRGVVITVQKRFGVVEGVLGCCIQLFREFSEIFQTVILNKIATLQRQVRVVVCTLENKTSTVLLFDTG